jgi:hypothetical protein
MLVSTYIHECAGDVKADKKGKRQGVPVTEVGKCTKWKKEGYPGIRIPAVARLPDA